MEVVSFQSACCVGQLHSGGGMLGPVSFRLGAQRWVMPFAPSPWERFRGEAPDELPDLLKFLASECPCVPFGIERELADLGSDWVVARSASKVMPSADPHGFGANHLWQVASLSPQEVYGRIQYPETHAIMSVERTVTARSDKTQLDFSVTIHPRHDINLPIGIHPVFALPEQPGAAQLRTRVPKADLRAWTFPAKTHYAYLTPDQRACPLDKLQGVEGTVVDITQLPLSARHEDLVLLTGLAGALTLRLVDWNYEVSVIWDPLIFPACLLWLSNGALENPPFCRGYRAIGIEPIAAPFDLGMRTAIWKENPLARSGVATAIAFSANQPWRTQYAITCRGTG